MTYFHGVLHFIIFFLQAFKLLGWKCNGYGKVRRAGLLSYVQVLWDRFCSCGLRKSCRDFIWVEFYLTFGLVVRWVSPKRSFCLWLQYVKLVGRGYGFGMYVHWRWVECVIVQTVCVWALCVVVVVFRLCLASERSTAWKLTNAWLCKWYLLRRGWGGEVGNLLGCMSWTLPLGLT